MLNPARTLPAYLPYLLLLVLICLFARFVVNFSIPPFEDAAMVMRYADNFAQGHGFGIWNIGEKPVDGATDVLFVLAVGLIAKAGLTVEVATRGLTFVSHLLTMVILFRTLRSVVGVPLVWAMLTALYFGIGPGLYLTAAYFGTPFFVLFTTLTLDFALRLFLRGQSPGLAIGFSSCGLIAGMIRPEGVFFAAFLLLMIVARLGWRRSIVIITCFVGVFGVFGGIYFLWRWSYFGYPLPNPFYRKGGGSLYPEGLRASILNVLQMGLPFLLLYIPAWVQKRRRRLVITALIPVIGFTLIWVLLSDEMNFGGRFQYPVLPIILCVCCVLNMPPLLSARPRAWGMVGMILMLCYGLVFNRATYGADGRYDIGRRLARYEGYTIATSEAGLVPFYSGWRTVDTWGLNDQWIAHNGGVTAEYLDRVQPQIVMFHRFSYPTTPAWDRMIATLQGYVERRKYVLAARYGVHPSDTHDYYVRADLPDSEAMIAAIRDINYIWFNTGTSAMNFVPDR